MNKPQPCTESYNQELKQEIIEDSDHVKEVLDSNRPLALYLVIFTTFMPVGVPVMMGILFENYSATLIGLVGIPLYFLAWVFYQEARQLEQEDHTETHRLAEIFRREAAAHRAHCLQALRQNYAE